MPIETDDKLKALIAGGRITSVTLDTNVFDGQNLNFNSAIISTISKLKDIPFSFILSMTVTKEVRSHIENATTDALRSVRKEVGKALFAYGVTSPTRDELIATITGGKSPSDAASHRLQKFLDDSECEVIEDSKIVDSSTIFDAYFNRNPPFSQGKKTEFPDALALHALDKTAATRGTGFLVVSEDGDWRAFCEKSEVLFWVPKIEKALSLINDAPALVKKAVVSWLGPDMLGRVELQESIGRYVEGLDVDVTASPSSGEMQAHAWAPTAQSIEWPDENDVEIISMSEISPRHLQLVVSFPISIVLRHAIDIEFSVWDSVDKESLSMGGRTVEVDRENEAQVTITIEVSHLGADIEQINLDEMEIDIDSIDVDLGEVDVFEHDDYDD